MKLTNIATLIMAIGVFFISCNNKNNAEGNFPIKKNNNSAPSISKELLIGSWLDESAAALHFTLFADGTAKSNNMQTLLYQNWNVEGNQLKIVVKSIGNANSSVDTLTYEIEKLNENEMVIKQANVISKHLKIKNNHQGDLNSANKTLSNQESKILSGELTIGHETNTFKPCGSDKVFWVADKTGKLKKLYEELIKGKEPYTPIFTKIEITDIGKAREGFPSDYESVYEVRKVLETRKTSEKDCQ